MDQGLKTIKETENLIFFSARLNFISLMNTKTMATHENTTFGEKKFDLILKKSNFLYVYEIQQSP